ncbi:MAG: hypothetical protein AAF355_05810 [Myxococcota bacterium]
MNPESFIKNAKTSRKKKKKRDTESPLDSEDFDLFRTCAFEFIRSINEAECVLVQNKLPESKVNFIDATTELMQFYRLHLTPTSANVSDLDSFVRRFMPVSSASYSASDLHWELAILLNLVFGYWNQLDLHLASASRLGVPMSESLRESKSLLDTQLDSVIRDVNSTIKDTSDQVSRNKQILNACFREKKLSQERASQISGQINKVTARLEEQINTLVRVDQSIQTLSQEITSAVETTKDRALQRIQRGARRWVSGRRQTEDASARIIQKSMRRWLAQIHRHQAQQRQLQTTDESGADRFSAGHNVASRDSTASSTPTAAPVYKAHPKLVRPLRTPPKSSPPRSKAAPASLRPPQPRPASRYRVRFAGPRDQLIDRFYAGLTVSPEQRARLEQRIVRAVEQGRSSLIRDHVLPDFYKNIPMQHDTASNTAVFYSVDQVSGDIIVYAIAAHKGRGNKTYVGQCFNPSTHRYQRFRIRLDS